MPIWRITQTRHSALDGEGSRLYGGRWTPRGLPAVYCSATLSLAALERFVQTDPVFDAPDLVAIGIELPDTLTAEHVAVEDLPADWRSYPSPPALAAVGERWLQAAKTPLLTVPSAVIPRERNYVINPNHPAACLLRIVVSEPFSFDPRLWRKRDSGRRRRH